MTDDITPEGGEGELASSPPGRHTRRAVSRRRQEARSGSKVFAIIKEAGIVLGTALVLSLLIKTFLAQAFFIPSESMEDTLGIGDRVMVSLLTPGPFDLERGDVIVFRDPGGWLSSSVEPQRGPVAQATVDALTFIGVLPHDAGQHLIKRVIGLPGDTVKCCDAQGNLTVNDRSIDETSYIRPGVDASSDEFEVVIPKGRVWVMGDNRANSEDSRAHWVASGGDVDASTVPSSNIVGRAVFVFYPWDQRTWLSNHEEVFGQVPAPASP